MITGEKMRVHFCRFYDVIVTLMSLIKEEYLLKMENAIYGFVVSVVSDRKVRVYQKSKEITLASLISTRYISISRNKIIAINNNAIDSNCYQQLHTVILTSQKNRI